MLLFPSLGHVWFKISHNPEWQLKSLSESIGALHDPVTWYGINYAGTQITQWGLSKQRKAGLDWYEFICFVSPTVLFAFQYNLFRTMQRAYLD